MSTEEGATHMPHHYRALLPVCNPPPAARLHNTGDSIAVRHVPSSRIMVTPDRLRALFDTHHQPLVRYLTRQMGDRDWAEEIAQETFVRALKQDVIASERSWIFAVAMNLMRDEARREARHRRRLELMRDEAKAGSVVMPGPTSMERDEEREMARKAVAMLAERDRDALLMKEEGLSYDEIAAALDLSAASVGTTLSRARRRLMEAYEQLQAGHTAERA